MNTQYLLAIVIIGVGLRFLSRGYAIKSTPRIMTGVAIAIIGAAQFFRAKSIVAITLMAVGFMLFVASLFVMKVQHGRVIRPNEPRRRR